MDLVIALIGGALKEYYSELLRSIEKDCNLGDNLRSIIFLKL